MRKAMVLGLFVIVGCLVMLSWAQRRPERRLPGQAQQSPEQHKAVTRRVFDDLWNQGRYELISEVYTRDCVVHDNNKSMRIDEAVAEGKGWRSAAPDVQMTPDNMTVDGDIVTVHWTGRGTHTGRGNGLMRPTGKKFVSHGVSRFRIENGKIAEVWNTWDRNDVFRQIGVSRSAAYLFDKAEDLTLAFNRMFPEATAIYFDR